MPLGLSEGSSLGFPVGAAVGDLVLVVFLVGAAVGDLVLVVFLVGAAVGDLVGFSVVPMMHLPLNVTREQHCVATLVVVPAPRQHRGVPSGNLVHLPLQHNGLFPGWEIKSGQPLGGPMLGP
jgi:hypothetical protein